MKKLKSTKYLSSCYASILAKLSVDWYCIVYISLFQFSWVQYNEFQIIFYTIFLNTINMNWGCHFASFLRVLIHDTHCGFTRNAQRHSWVNPHFSILSSRSGALSFTFYEQFFRFLSFYIYSYNSFNELIIHFFAVIRIFLVINFLYVRFFVLFATIAVSFFTFWKFILLF